MINIISKQEFVSGESLSFIVKTDLPFIFTVFCLTNSKYFVYNTSTGVWSTTTTPTSNSIATLTSYPLVNGFRHITFSIPTNLIPKPSVFVIYGQDTDTIPNVFETSVFYGLNIPTSASTINVYGTLFDAYGNPVEGESLVFSVLNETTYFDNSKYTSFNAYTQTNEQGFFSINLNRKYDYALSIPRLGFTKILKISNVPASNSSVEVDFGGLGQC